ncbi:hypothetical protein D3C78_852030 [compost metagenome]
MLIAVTATYSYEIDTENNGIARYRAIQFIVIFVNNTPISEPRNDPIMAIVNPSIQTINFN